MRFSVESRVPFLTLDMVNLLLSMPEEFLVSSSGQTKSVFRAAMRGIVPEDILLRKDKIGFATPRRLIPSSALGDLIVLYKNMYPREQEFLNFESVARVFSEEVSSECSDRRKWRLINFLRWRVLFGS
jgi:asparagine synthase (glutamine-hydrolysing)